MRSLSNLLKAGYISVDRNDVRIIDGNQPAQSRMRTAAQDVYERTGIAITESAVQNAAEALFAAMNQSSTETEGEFFSEGLNAEEVFLKESVEYSGPSPEEIALQAQAEAEAIIAQAQAEADQIRREAMEEGKRQGYEEGRRQGLAELDIQKNEFMQKQAEQEAEYEKQLEQLEPVLIDTLTGIYQHIFRVDMSHYSDIVLHLLENTVRNIEGSRDFLVHVSKNDYPVVNMRKKQLTDAVSMNNVTFEIVEDLTLRPGECLIETEGGIYDCGLGTQLDELERELKILSYKK